MSDNPTQTLFGRLPLLPLVDRPLVSIVVPSFNQGKFIRETIDSILSQDYRPLEIHVIDGGSTDGTLSVLGSYSQIDELTWTSEPDNGVVDAVNKGFSRVRGDLVAIQSSDDTYLPRAISSVVQTFQRQQNVGLIYGDTVKVDAEGIELARYRIGPYSLENLLLLNTWIPQPSAFFRREMLEYCGGWDERIPYAPDTDLWIRMAFRTDVVKLDAFLSKRRLHEAQRDTQAAKIAGDYARMIAHSTEITAAEPVVRRAAQAGVHLMRIRYNATGSDWYAAWHLFWAGVIDRRARNLKGVIHHLILPMRRQLSWVKQHVFRLPGRSEALSAYPEPTKDCS